MKFSSTILSLLCATLASSTSYNFGANLGLSSSQNALVDDPDKVSVPGQNPLFYCAAPTDYILNITFVDLVPNPPKPGETLHIIANGTLSKDVEAGTKVALLVKYGLINLIKQEADLCDNLPRIGESCPLKAGPISIVKQVDIPKQVPPGKYSVLADVFTPDAEKVTCLEAQVFFTRQ